MPSANLTVNTSLATIQSNNAQRTVTLALPAIGTVLPPGIPGRHFVLSNIGPNGARIGVLGQTLAGFGAGANADGQADLGPGESLRFDRGMPGFVHRSGSGTTLRLTSGAG